MAMTGGKRTAPRINPEQPAACRPYPIGCRVLHRYPLRHGRTAFCRFFVKPVFPWPDIAFSSVENLTIRSNLTLEEAHGPVK
jgi:hypothetical protein